MIVCSDLVLFVSQDGNTPWLARCIALTRADFYCSLTVWVCPFCGVENSHGRYCVGCQAPKPTKGGQVVLEGALPGATEIAQLKDGFELCVMYGPCTRPDVFETKQMLLHVTNCKVVRKTIPRLMCLRAEQNGVVTLYMVVSGDIKLKEITCD